MDTATTPKQGEKFLKSKNFVPKPVPNWGKKLNLENFQVLLPDLNIYPLSDVICKSENLGENRWQLQMDTLYKNKINLLFRKKHGDNDVNGYLKLIGVKFKC